jgi:NodT family efflux transporter outer membrane factor (OMF) lipoprotein
VGLAASLLLAACATGDRYRAAPLSVPAQYGHGDSRLNAPTQPLSEVTDHAVTLSDAEPWSRAFGDPRLDRLVDLALQVNTDLVVAGLRLQRAHQVAGLVDNEAWPQFDGSLSSSLSQPLSDDTTSRRSSGARVSVSYEVDLWGRLRAQRDVAHWQAQASAEDLQATGLLLIAETCDRYWALAALNQRFAHGNDSLALAERTLRLVQSQFDAGAVSRVEVREAQQRLYSQRAAQSQLLQLRVEARNALTVLLDGSPWPEQDEPQDLDDAISRAPDAGIPAEVLGRRPDLRAAELRLRATAANFDVVRSSYYPALSLTGALGTSSASLLDVLHNPVATLGAGLTLPFLRGREMRLNTGIAGTDHAIAANEFRRLLYAALAEVDNALSARIQFARQVELLQLSLAAAQQIERLYDVRYRAGATPLRIWLDAQETRRNADLALTLGRLQLLRNDLTLFQALGGGAL